ncbi:MAG: energy-coupling factor transporter transmembrane component T, partial [Bacteroidota bacterium]
AVALSWHVNFMLLAFLLTASFCVTLHKKTITRKAFWRFLFSIFFFIALITIFNSVLYREGRTIEGLGGIIWYEGGLQFGLKTSSRLAVISATLFLFFLFTPLREFLHFLQNIGLPSPLVVVLFLALHFVGQLPNRIQKIYTAQEARGAPVRGSLFRRVSAFFSILSPLVLSSMIETLERGTALESRGFRGHLAKSNEAVTTPLSLLLSLFLIGIAVSLIVWSLLR